jgi:hypothetical protein
MELYDSFCLFCSKFFGLTVLKVLYLSRVQDVRTRAETNGAVLLEIDEVGANVFLLRGRNADELARQVVAWFQCMNRDGRKIVRLTLLLFSLLCSIDYC